jgi:hypothetical protein
MHVVQTTAVILQATASVAPAHKTLLPRDVPTITSDPWQCATVNATQYFDPPKPTGTLLTALLSYADKLYEGCTPIEDPTGNRIPACPFPDASRWCAFTSTVAPTMTPAYWSYASSASSWWSAKSSGASSVASRCPNKWYKIMRETPGGETWLNDTMIFAECYELGHPPTALPSPSKTGV